MKSCKTKFLESSILGQQINKTDKEAVILRCIELAYKDMMTAGRYYISSFSFDKAYICSNVEKLLSANNYSFSRDLIDKTSVFLFSSETVGSGNKYVSRYGLAQKLVNMTFKYFYVFEDYMFLGDNAIAFSNCDCPLDSIILSKIPDMECVWSKLTKKQYEKCQNTISEILKNENIDDELNKLGNLAFDFINW
ncbi:MAG: hypothetical protein RR229_05260 [Oscillospiraceae bacterium]